MKIGYAGVSSNTQDLELQKQALVDSGCTKIWQKGCSQEEILSTKLQTLPSSL